MLNALLSATTTLAGMSLLFGSWDRRLQARRWAVAAGWASLAISVYFWSRTQGPEFGATIAVLAPALVAWLLAARGAEIRSKGNRPRSQRSKSDVLEQQQEVASPRSWIRHVMLFVVTVPLSAAAAAIVSVAVATWLPWIDLNEMVFALIVMPILWGSAAYWAVADPQPLRPALSVLTAGLIGAAMLYL
jgi:Ca2+/H+ antiporter